MAAPDDPGPSYPNAMYQRVKEWAAKQEAFEKENKAPAPLNNVERAFLDSFCKPSMPLDDGKDYVSVLCKYRQKMPKGNQITFVDCVHPVRNEQGASQWSCTVELSEAIADEYRITSFPATGFGLDLAGCYRAFAKKKDAKQYAAKCAIEWLDNKSLLPSNLRALVGLERNLPAIQSQPIKRPNEGTKGALPPPSKRTAHGSVGAIEGEDDISLSTTARVHALCHRMKLQAPRYALTLAYPGVNNVFNGRPDFGDDGSTFPEDLGRVTGVRGRENARQEISEKVLVHLGEMHRERAANLADFLQRLDRTGP